MLRGRPSFWGWLINVRHPLLKGSTFAPMFRVIVRSLLLVWLQFYMLGPEMMKLPLLWGHYQEHVTLDGTLSFGDFIDLHYADGAHEEADHEGHKDLPFHHHHGATVDHCACKVWTSDPTPAVSFPTLMGDRPVGRVHDDAERAGHRRALLQPPRTQA
jgi:hypothetical protein